jgi:tRNA A37 threonylcarbamoyladenosine synthetase subunit TsaC/SUA5/YrdC
MTKELSDVALNGVISSPVVRLSDLKLNPASVLAAKVLLQGKVIALPTDTIYGIAALVQSKEAVQKLYTIKGQKSFYREVCLSFSDSTRPW